jgi:hypothetical protein
LCTLAARQAAAAQLGPNLPDGVVKRDHRPLLLCGRRDARTVPIGPGQGRRRRRAAGRGGADFAERR